MNTLPPFGDRRRRRVGLLGGSFNPAHEGHRHVSLEALRRLGLDEVWWLVSPQNPLKSGDGMEPLASRLARAHEIARDPRIKVEAPELALGTRYTLDTVRALKRLYPRAHFVWLMGADILPQLVDWANWRDLFAAIPIAAFARPGWSHAALNSTAPRAFRQLSHFAFCYFRPEYSIIHTSHSLGGHTTECTSTLDCLFSHTCLVLLM